MFHFSWSNLNATDSMKLYFVLHFSQITAVQSLETDGPVLKLLRV